MLPEAEVEVYSGNSKWSRIVICFATAICIVFLFVSFLKIIKKNCLTSRFPPSVVRLRTQGANLNENNQNDSSLNSQSRGLASAVIHSLPVIQFREEIGDSNCKGNSNEECAVCLGEFAEGEWLRLLPICTHLFHAYCIDTWFHSHSSCPLCRTDVLYGFSSNSPSVSIVAPLETLEREGISQERLLDHHHLESEQMQNHFRWGTITGAAQPRSTLDESVPSVVSSISVVYHQ